MSNFRFFLAGLDKGREEFAGATGIFYFLYTEEGLGRMKNVSPFSKHLEPVLVTSRMLTHRASMGR